MGTGRTIVWIDFETGGLDPDKHQVIEVGAIATSVPALVELERFEQRVTLAPGRTTPEALAINHYSEERWKDAVDSGTAIQNLAAFLEKHATADYFGRRVALLGGHNFLTFDSRFLEAWAKRWKVRLPCAFRHGYMWDTIHLAQTYALVCGSSFENLKLETLCRWAGVEYGELHTAMADVSATVDLARCIVENLAIE